MNGGEPTAPTPEFPLGLALLSSLGAALPAVIRIAGDGPLLGASLALFVSVSLVVVPVGFWLRRAVESGFRAVDRAIALGAALASLPLALFGGVLKSSTHHRPLGGATFAVAALCLLALCGVLAYRLTGRGRASQASPLWPSLFTSACVLAFALTLALAASAATARSSLFDFLAVGLSCVATGFAKGRPGKPGKPDSVRLGSRVLLGVWLLLIVFAVIAIRDDALAFTLTSRAPVVFASLSWLGGGS